MIGKSRLNLSSMDKISPRSNNYRQGRPSVEQGYIALMSVIVMGAVLTTVAVSFMERVMVSRLNSLSALVKSQTQELALACSARALLNYALDPSYRGDEAVNFADGQCTIKHLSMNDI